MHDHHSESEESGFTSLDRKSRNVKSDFSNLSKLNSDKNFDMEDGEKADVFGRESFTEQELDIFE